MTKFLQLTLPTNVDKIQKLTLSNTSFQLNGEDHEIREDPKDPLCAIKVFEHFWYVFAGSNYQGRIFRRRASVKEIKRRQLVGDRREMGFDMHHAIGKNSLSNYTVSMAKRCGFDNPDRNTAHGKRKEGISAMSNAKEAVDGKLIMASSRHKCERLNYKYRKPNDIAMEKKYKALLDKGYSTSSSQSSSSSSSSFQSSSSSTSNSSDSVQFIKSKKRKSSNIKHGKKKNKKHRKKKHKIRSNNYSNLKSTYVTPSPHPQAAISSQGISHQYSVYHPPPPLFSPAVQPSQPALQAIPTTYYNTSAQVAYHHPNANPAFANNYSYAVASAPVQHQMQPIYQNAPPSSNYEVQLLPHDNQSRRRIKRERRVREEFEDV